MHSKHPFPDQPLISGCITRYLCQPHNHLLCNQMKLLLTSTILLALTLSVVSASESYCPKIKSKGEGHWPIPEKAFTKENAESEEKKLEEAKALYNKDPMLYGESLEFTEDNATTIIEGYKLKKKINEAQKNNGNLKEAIDNFCYFLKEHAYVSH